MKKRYAYKVTQVTPNDSADEYNRAGPAGIELALNRMAAEGWEYVGVLPVPDGNLTHWRYVFRKPT